LVHIDSSRIAKTIEASRRHDRQRPGDGKADRSVTAVTSADTTNVLSEYLQIGGGAQQGRIVAEPRLGSSTLRNSSDSTGR
jgi:hypothetical protein